MTEYIGKNGVKFELTEYTPIKSLVKQRHGMLEVLSHWRGKGRGTKKNTYWVLCKCDCGKTVIRSQENVMKCGRQSLEDTTNVMSSCGCSLNKKKVGRSYSKKRHEGLTYHRFNKIQRGAIDRNIPFSITIEETWNLFIQQGGKCALTGLEIEINDTHAKFGTASLDRINSDLGYITGNIWWIHQDCQTIKWTRTIERTIELCRLLVAHADANKIKTLSV